MRTCTVCRHSAREEIDRALLDGEPFRDISVQFHLSVGALHRHKMRHMAPLLQAAQQTAGKTLLDDMLGRLDGIEVEGKRLAGVAEQRGDLKTAGHLLVSEARAILELAARLRGLLQQGAPAVQVNIEDPALDEQRVLHAATDIVAALIRGLPADLRARVVECLQWEHQERRRKKLIEAEQRMRALLPPNPIRRSGLS